SHAVERGACTALATTVSILAILLTAQFAQTSLIISGRRFSNPVRSGKSNVLRSGPIAGFSEGLRSKAERWRNATRGFVLNPNDSMRERLTYLRAPPSLRDTGRSSTT